MKIHFYPRENSPEHLVCEAEVVFDKGALEGLKLVGFSIWKGPDGEAYVTLPSHAFGARSETRYFDYLRAVNGSPESVKKFKQWVLAELKRLHSYQ